MTTIGTSYFATKGHAIKYYAQHDPSATEKEIQEWVDCKLENGEIHIGQPVLKTGESLNIDDDGRYHKTF